MHMTLIINSVFSLLLATFDFVVLEHPWLFGTWWWWFSQVVYKHNFWHSLIPCPKWPIAKEYSTRGPLFVLNISKEGKFLYY